jgi:hypothetical protein
MFDTFPSAMNEKVKKIFTKARNITITTAAVTSLRAGQNSSTDPIFSTPYISPNTTNIIVPSPCTNTRGLEIPVPRLSH